MNRHAISTNYWSRNTFLHPNVLDTMHPCMSFISREAVKKIDHAFPVSLACNKERFPAARCLLFNIYCCEPKLEADWHGLAIPLLKPEWIENLKTYKKLFFSWNSLTVLPNNMACLNNLLRLDLQHNSLQAIPGCLLQLPLLRNLNISHNMIQSLPVVDRWTSSLNILDIQGNFLYTFPECVDGATIQYLNLADNRLVKIPNGLCKLKSLTSLDIGGNKEIHDLPMQLGKLSKLVDLSLKGLQVILIWLYVTGAVTEYMFSLFPYIVINI